MISLSDFSGRLFAPFTAFALRPLSNSASTASCSILFSFLIIISGASSSSRRFRRLFLFITRRYRSFTSETANLPPSRLTSGLRSGGRTGKFVIIIHSGRLPEFKKLSITFRRFTIVFFLASEFVASISSCS